MSDWKAQYAKTMERAIVILTDIIVKSQQCPGELYGEKGRSVSTVNTNLPDQGSLSNIELERRRR